MQNLKDSPEGEGFRPIVVTIKKDPPEEGPEGHRRIPNERLA